MLESLREWGSNASPEAYNAAERRLRESAALALEVPQSALHIVAREWNVDDRTFRLMPVVADCDVPSERLAGRDVQSEVMRGEWIEFSRKASAFLE